MTRAALAVLAVVLLAAAPAHADRTITRATAVAVAYWHADPCPGSGVDWPVAPDPLTDPAYGPIDALAFGAGPCTVELSPTYWPAKAYASLVATCSMVVHEVGHLLGHGHSPNPRSAMHPPPPRLAVCAREFCPDDAGRILRADRRIREVTLATCETWKLNRHRQPVKVNP